jgi:hypothetical protein
MQEYLREGGFLLEKINNRKNASFLYNKLDEDHYVNYVEGTAIKSYLKKYFGIKIDILVDKIFIMKYANHMKFKIIIDTVKNSKLQKLPYIKQYYDMVLGHIGTIEYAVVGKIKDAPIINILKTCDIYIFDTEDQNKIDMWLDE